MGLKFYLNKLIKIDNIENYTLKTLSSLKSNYDKFLEDSNGIDPDYPNLSFGTKGKTFKLGKGMTDEELLELGF